MELRHLRYFRVVAIEENFSRASQQLRIAQPALSRRIRDLEGELGVELFERLPRGVRLSAAGRAFLVEVEDILTRVDAAIGRTKRFVGGHLGTVRVGLSELVATDEFISRKLRDFRVEEPGVLLELRSLGALLQFSIIKDAQLDACIVYEANIDERDARLLQRATIGRGEVMLAVHKSHPLAQRDSVCMSEIADEPLLWPERRLQPEYYDRLMRACLKAGVPPNILQECTTSSILMSLVSVGMGAGLVTATQPIAAVREIRLIPLLDLGLSFDILLVWRKDDLSPALGRFITAMKEQSSMPAAGQY